VKKRTDPATSATVREIVLDFTCMGNPLVDDQWCGRTDPASPCLASEFVTEPGGNSTPMSLAGPGSVHEHDLAGTNLSRDHERHLTARSNDVSPGAPPRRASAPPARRPGELPYIASKAALRELTPTLAAHLIGRGITVNCVNPGPNNTGHGDEAAWTWVAERNPGGRASTPQDTARLVGWLVTDEAEWVTGQVIASDGGWSLLGA
jgi:NAD(P)-dependent dehydrogenase (short-subunit alcohol dehydrogenase family)